MNWEAFFTLHSDLPREGPGTRADVDWACAVASVSEDARILDAGCGPGADIEGLLANAPKGHVLAVDTHAPFVDAAAARYPDEPRLSLDALDMATVEGPFDFIWSAGALYFLGITDGLARMSAKLAPGGTIAFSHLVYTVTLPDPALQKTFAEEPDIMTADQLGDQIRDLGFDILDQRLLPEASWESYYGPMRARIDLLRPDADADLTAVLDENAAEADLRKRFGHQYGYVLSVVRPK